VTVALCLMRLPCASFGIPLLALLMPVACVTPAPQPVQWSFSIAQETGRLIDGRRAHLYHPGQTRPPVTRRRSPALAVAARHHHRSPAADGITTTTSPGGAV
jgi:hypothetical protein